MKKAAKCQTEKMEEAGQTDARLAFAKGAGIDMMDTNVDLALEDMVQGYQGADSSPWEDAGCMGESQEELEELDGLWEGAFRKEWSFLTRTAPCRSARTRIERLKTRLIDNQKDRIKAKDVLQKAHKLLQDSGDAPTAEAMVGRQLAEASVEVSELSWMLQDLEVVEGTMKSADLLFHGQTQKGRAIVRRIEAAGQAAAAAGDAMTDWFMDQFGGLAKGIF